MEFNNRDLQGRLQALTEYVSGLSNSINGNGGILSTLQAQNQTIQGLLLTQANTPAVPTANLLWNGELSHSVFTWNTTPPPTSPTNPTETAQNAECQQFYSNNLPTASKTFTAITVANQIPITDHGFTTGTTVDLTTTGTLPTGLALATTYFVYVLNPNVIQLATTIALAEAGTPDVAITVATGSGTHTIQQLLLETNSLTSTTNNELKTSAHVNYNPRYSKWDSTSGQGDLTGTMTIDALMPMNNIDATTPLARVSLIAARRNSYIEIPEECLFGAGIWDNTSGQRCFLTGDIGFTAATVGTPGTTTRAFRILLTSDRGYSLLSDEVTIINAPADGFFSSTSNIQMSWKQQAGQLQVAIYEFTSGVYRLVANVSSATSYIYEGDYLQVVGGYPTATGTELTATYFTQTGDMSDLGVNGIVPFWDTVNFPIGVPDTYNKGNTTDRQWVRLWMTVAANLFIPSNVTTDGTTTITIPTGILNTAEYGTGGTSLYVGLEVQVFDSLGAQISTETITSVTSDTAIVVTGTVASGTNRQLRIVGGGFHGILVDKIHLGYDLNTAFAPNANDVRALQPLAAPNGSSQGTTGAGGTGGGVDTCIAMDTPVKTIDGATSVQFALPGQRWATVGLRPNLLRKLRLGMDYVRRVRTANGCEIICTDTEAFIRDRDDEKGTPLWHLRVGDSVLTEIDDRIEETTIVSISPFLGKMQVFTPVLSGSHLFLAGRLKLMWHQRLWNWLTRQKQITGYFVLHNRKGL
jgi:hypothetical protein